MISPQVIVSNTNEDELAFNTAATDELAYVLMLALPLEITLVTNNVLPPFWKKSLAANDVKYS
jgi:hypothetical protein